MLLYVSIDLLYAVNTKDEAKLKKKLKNKKQTKTFQNKFKMAYYLLSLGHIKEGAIWQSWCLKLNKPFCHPNLNKICKLTL